MAALGRPQEHGTRLKWKTERTRMQKEYLEGTTKRIEGPISKNDRIASLGPRKRNGTIEAKYDCVQMTQ